MVGLDELPECLQEFSLAGGPSFGGPSFGGPVGGPSFGGAVGGSVGGPIVGPAALDRCCPIFDPDTQADCFEGFRIDVDMFVLAQCPPRSPFPATLPVTAAPQSTATPATGTAPPVVRRRRQAGAFGPSVHPDLLEALQDVCRYNSAPFSRKKRAACIDAELVLSDGTPVEAFEVCEDINVIPSLKEAQLICLE